MDAARWREIRTHFETALEKPLDDRAAYLDEACGDDKELRREVDALLAADTKAEKFLEEPPRLGSGVEADGEEPDADPGARWIGRHVGAYRLTRLLGRGGMGTVYAAERADRQFEQRVAIKLVRWDVDTPEIRQRFHMERRILASLQHPNIARLLDGGVTDDGVPYLVMEYVEGQPITAYCEAHSLLLNPRLELFCTVCAAMQYAHQNLVVHRDLKPTNILVTEGGIVKLLDFGIAKLLDVSAAADSPDVPKTRTGMQRLTPDYAAPEQFRGEAITTATDVYQLGVLFYELMTGRRPYQVGGLMPGEVERVVCTEVPARPSVAASQRARDQERSSSGESTRDTIRPERPSRLRGDLDNIALKALRKEPERRYASVEQLADDIRRHLNGWPVSARPDTLGYRARKFVQRHRAGVVATTLVIVTLIGGLTAALWQARVAEQQRQRAEQRLADVRELAGSFLFDFHDAIVDLPGSTAARELVVEKALEYLDRISRQGADDPELRLDLAVAYRKVGDVQGNPTNANLGHTQDAMVSYQRGLRLAQSVLQLDPSNVEAQIILANILEKLGDVQAATGDLTAAETSKRRAVDMYRRFASRYPDEGDRQVSYAVSLIKLGDILGNPNFSNQGRLSDALRQYREARAILSGFYAPETPASNTTRLFGLVHERIGTIHDEQGQFDAALEAYRRSLELRQQYADARPSNTDAMRDRAVAHEKMGDMQVRMENLEAARAQYHQSRDIFARLAELDSLNVQAQRSLAISHIHLGDLAYHPSRSSFDDPEMARTHFETARDLLADTRRGNATDDRTQSLLEMVNRRLSQLPDHPAASVRSGQG